MGKVFKGINVAGSNRKIDATATRTGTDGTGYYRGSDGLYYYGNPHNGYLTETTQSQEYRASQEATKPARPSYTSNTNSAPSKGTGMTLEEFIISLWLSLKTTFWLIAFLVVFFPLSAIVFGTLYAWPYFIKLLVLSFAQGNVNLGQILIVVPFLVLIVHFAFCSYTVFTKRVSCIKRFLIPSAFVAVLLALISGMGGHNSGNFFVILVTSFALLILPTILICFFEHLATKEQRGDQRWFITRVAKLIGPFLPGKATGMIVFGAVIAVLGVLFTFVDSKALFITVGLVLEGGLLAAMGILNKIK